MTSDQRNLICSAAGALLAVAVLAIPASAGWSALTADAPALPYDLSVQQVALDEVAAADTADAPQVAAAEAGAGADADSLECMSKVVHHEAKNQSRRGQLAVAQALVNRLRAGRFGGSICDVARQRGQFFDVTAYRPRRDTAEWETAMAVSRAAMRGDAEQVAPGALFFRASYAPANSFFRTRRPVATVGAHIFYR